jgi:hypothetical protein
MKIFSSQIPTHFQGHSGKRSEKDGVSVLFQYVSALPKRHKAKLNFRQCCQMPMEHTLIELPMENFSVPGGKTSDQPTRLVR